jgi:hypothetical protein
MLSIPFNVYLWESQKDMAYCGKPLTIYILGLLSNGRLQNPYYGEIF